jgi:two-component system, OmpR family, phosphate regulon sensor histidine kinase PhoR
MGATYVLIALVVVAYPLLAVLWLRARRANARVREVSRERAQAVTARAEADAARRIAICHLDGVGEADQDALLVLDKDRRVVWGNSSAWEMFGVTGSAVGQSFIGITHDYELNQAVADTLSGRRVIVRQSAASERTLRIRVAPIEETGGAAVAVGNVTELQRLGRARRDFVANISHELRTPLASIDLAAQTLENSQLNDRGLAHRMLDQIQRQVQTLSQLSQEMMDLAQIESGQVLLKLVPGDVAVAVHHAIEPLLPQAALKDQHISVTVPEDLRALMDEGPVARVIRNLVHNAIKFTPGDGIISISAGNYGEDDVLITVSDSGPGIPEAEQVRIFERFYKQDRARSRGGTGLGLAIARHIVEGHGGRIWVESTPGQGARFCLTLPRA